MDAESLKLLLITANVGSIFEDPEHMLKLWLKEFLGSVRDMEPGMVAIHCQEVGGKNYEASMQHVNQFVKAMLGSDELQKYDRARVFLDEDYTAADKFTALGNLYFIHECVEDVMIYDFIDCKFLPVEGREVLSGNIENIQIKEKAKYPQNFFPDFKWSRKGFLRTRWNINNCVFDLINIHLFHDASNIIALQKSPSVYCENRYRALAHTLQRFETDQFDKVPFFIFGDFNFRLDLKSMLKDLMEKSQPTEIRGKKNQISKLTYNDANSKVVLTIESKYFDHHERHNDVFSNKDKLLNKYDRELDMYKDKLYEFDIDFPPSYPFSEDVSDGLSYMKTRCPSWCDRILLSSAAKDILHNDGRSKPTYNIIGADICMGDHKPVYLLLRLKKGKGNDMPDFNTQSSFERRKLLAQKISINGETFDCLDENTDIHDYTRFERPDELPPDFRTSIRTRMSLRRQNHCEEEDSGGVREAGPSSDPNHEFNDATNAPKKARSFQDIARQVYLMENALMRWPRRPRTRHHSSSSEDNLDTETEDGDTDADRISVVTDTSEVSGIEKIDAEIEDVTSLERKPAQNAENSNQTPTAESSLRQRTTESAKYPSNERNVEPTTAINSVHDIGVVQHEHDKTQIVREVGAREKSGDGRERKGRKIRCPYCVLL